MTEDAPLSPQQLRFVEEMLIDPTSQVKAAKRAGYSISTASQAASRLMADTRVKQAIQLAQDARSKEIGISKERILQELARIAFADVGEKITVNEDGDIDLSTLRGTASEVIVNAISGKGGKNKAVSVKTVKMADKISALVKMGQHLGMFKEQEVSVHLTLDKLIEDSYKEPVEDSSIPSDETTPAT